MSKIASLARRARNAFNHFAWAELREVGLWPYMQFLFFTAIGRKRLINVTTHGEDLQVRSATPDIKVAMTSLSDEFSLLEPLLPADFDGLIVDAGGYIGTASIAMAHYFPKATILLVEPSSENFDMCRRNTEPYPSIHCVNKALGVDDGASVPLSNRGTGEWGYTIVEDPADKPDAVVLEDVETVSLAALKQDYGDRDIGIMKLDIEGGEHALLKNADQDMKDIPILFVELHDRIVPGCKKAFEDFSQGRTIVRSDGEKYLSLDDSIDSDLISVRKSA